MSVFMKIRELRHRRDAKNLDLESAKVELITEREESHRGNFVYPGVDTLARIEVEGQRVGEVDYGINPLGDRLYINMIEIRGGFRFRGYALATLWRLWKLHQVPIVPLHQRGDSTLFWTKARKRFAQAGALIEQDLRMSAGVPPVIKDLNALARTLHRCLGFRDLEARPLQRLPGQTQPFG